MSCRISETISSCLHMQTLRLAWQHAACKHGTELPCYQQRSAQQIGKWRLLVNHSTKEGLVELRVLCVVVQQGGQTDITPPAMAA